MWKEEKFVYFQMIVPKKMVPRVKTEFASTQSVTAMMASVAAIAKFQVGTYALSVLYFTRKAITNQSLELKMACGSPLIGQDLYIKFRSET